MRLVIVRIYAQMVRDMFPKQEKVQLTQVDVAILKVVITVLMSLVLQQDMVGQLLLKVLPQGQILLRFKSFLQ
ncbi:MAG: hypothetical protein D3906_06950 [Candidatus Electrothrix sp. AUS1_2]|nr:hypothetical protein [Candidatus Electrothrix sp. AUS1_2]